MDILEQYEKENQAISNRADRRFFLESECGFLTCLIIRISGNAIQNEHQANRVLISIAIVFFIIAGIILLVSRQGSTFQYTPVPVGKNIQEMNWPPLQK